MFKAIDYYLNRVTMYRFALYYVAALLSIATIFSYFGTIPYQPFAIMLSAASITLMCAITNKIFSWAFDAPTNSESAYITALILACLISPPQSLTDAAFWSLAVWASVWSMASKYIFALGKKHIFNPVALAVALTATMINQSASWWIGTAAMVPFVVAGGYLMVRKILRWDLVVSFFVAVFAAIALTHLGGVASFTTALRQTIWTSPLFFFAFVMLTEPLTTPPTRPLRIAYGLLVGFLFAPSTHVGSFYFTPELSLVAGNVLSYLISPKSKLLLVLQEKKLIAPDTYDFIFATEKSLPFKPGQYLEWTLAHKGTDSRGNRRYFTIASAPTEVEIRMGVKFYSPASSFKRELLTMTAGDTIMAAQLAGDFTLPDNKESKLAFLAGGIGITPFRSMIKYVLDKKEKRSIIMLYSNRTTADVCYHDVFDQAELELGIKTVYTLTDERSIPPRWGGERGRVTAHMIAEHIPDYGERIFFISGTQAMVEAFDKTLRELGVKKKNIKQDFFPGFA